MKYEELKRFIDSNIFENRQQLITGDILNSVLHKMVAELGRGYQFGGVVTPDTTISDIDSKISFLALVPGEYTSFGGLIVAEGEIALLSWDEEWRKTTIIDDLVAIRGSVAKLEGVERDTDINLLTIYDMVRMMSTLETHDVQVSGNLDVAYEGMEYRVGKKIKETDDSISAILNALSGKIERVELEYHSGDAPYISLLGKTEHLSFEDVTNLISDTTKFVTLLWGTTSFLLPQYFDGAAIIFTGVSVLGNSTEAIRVAMSVDDDFHTYVMALASVEQTNIIAREVAKKQNKLTDTDGSYGQRVKTLEDNSATKDELEDVEGIANNAIAIAEGKATGYVFATKEAMDSALEDREFLDKLHKGDNLYILALDVPDYWWDGTQARELETQKVDLSDYLTAEQIASLYATKSELADKQIKPFVATYNRTTFEEIRGAYEEGRDVVCNYGGRIYHLTVCTSQRIVLIAHVETTSVHTLVVSLGNSWTYLQTTLENTARRQSVITENDAYYPSSKAVMDYAASKTELSALQLDVNRIYTDFAEYDKTDFPDVTFGTPTREGAYIGANGQFVAAAGYNVSNDIEVVRGNLYNLYVGKEATIPTGIAVFSKKVVSQTPSGEKVSYVPQFVSAGGATPKSGYLVFLATEDMTIVTSYHTSATKLEVVRYGVLASLCTQIDVLRKAVDLKSFADGYYAQMRVGLADNLTPRGESVDAEFTERVVGGGMSITDGSAKYDEVRGNSVVWNQLARERTATSAYDYEDGKITIKSIPQSFNNSGYVLFRLVPNHKYAIKITSDKDYFRLGNYFAAGLNINANNGIIYSYSTAWDVVLGYSANAEIGTHDLRATVTDLTQMFGAGNEPTTYEEFLRRKPTVADEYAYNEGEIINNKVTAIKTTGVNLWDEKFEDGIIDRITGENAFSEIIHRSPNYIPILPDTEMYAGVFDGTGVSLWVMFYDDDKRVIEGYITGKNHADNLNNCLNTTFRTPTNGYYMRFYVKNDVTKVCINNSNLSVNGKYFPYEVEKTLDLSWIKDIKDTEGNVLFPDGLRSAEGVYDTITATKATKRIGNDGVVLAEPIEVTYDEKNMTIPIVAGGMEIAVAETPSSPLKARIIYGMDAYNQIVANKNNVGTLSSLATADKSSLVAAINELKAEIERMKNQ